MFIPGALDARSSLQVGPQSCKPFSIHSDVCVGDLITIVGTPLPLPSLSITLGVALLFAVCSIAGIGFFFWSIHAIRKMRQPSPFDEVEEEGKHALLPSPYQHLTLAFRGT